MSTARQLSTGALTDAGGRRAARRRTLPAKHGPGSRRSHVNLDRVNLDDNQASIRAACDAGLLAGAVTLVWRRGEVLQVNEIGYRDVEAGAVSFRFGDRSQINGVPRDEAVAVIAQWITDRENAVPTADLVKVNSRG